MEDSPRMPEAVGDRGELSAPPPNKALQQAYHSDRDAMTTNSPFAKAIRVEDRWVPPNRQQSGVEWGNPAGVTVAAADTSH